MDVSRKNQIMVECIQFLSRKQKPYSPNAYRILDWVEDNFDEIEFEGSYGRFPGSKSNRKYVRDDWLTALEAIDNNLTHQLEALPDYIDQNALILAEA